MTDELQRRVLVVDDSADLVESLAAALHLLGYDARTATTAEDALACMEAWLPEIVFLDLTMPDMHGIETLQKSRSTNWGQNMIMIAMTGWSAEAERDKALSAGFDLFIAKPFDLSMLRTTLAPFGAPQEGGGSLAS